MYQLTWLVVPYVKGSYYFTTDFALFEIFEVQFWDEVAHEIIGEDVVVAGLDDDVAHMMDFHMNYWFAET